MARQTDIRRPIAAERDESAETPPEPEWDVVAQASWESFPASDPPGWINLSRRDPPATRPTR